MWQIVQWNEDNILSPIFIDNALYQQYYYEYISDYLYPQLLSVAHDPNKNLLDEYNNVMKIAYTNIAKDNQHIILCDYHLHWLLPLLKEKNIVFFWFIPFFRNLNDTELHKTIVENMSHAHIIFFLNQEYADNYLFSFKKYFPDDDLKTKIKVALLWPDDIFLSEQQSNKNEAIKTISQITNWKELKKDDQYFLSISRMDIVKDIPTAIQAFDMYMKKTQEKNKYFIIIAPHHRPNSLLYIKEEKLIYNLINSSIYKENIIITHMHIEKKSLRTLYEHACWFLCTSIYDWMPLTALEFILSNHKQWHLYSSNWCWVTWLFSNITTNFPSNNYNELAKKMIAHNNTFPDVHLYEHYISLAKESCLWFRWKIIQEEI